MKKMAVIAALLLSAGCSSCDDDEMPKSGVDLGRGDAGSIPSDAGDAGGSGLDGGFEADADDDFDARFDAELDAGGQDGGESDASADAETDTGPTAVCGNSTTEAGEQCDDGNTSDGDYCSGDCASVTGSCGDGTLQSNETCDDGSTSDCANTHDGGDGACVPTGTCSAGYELDGNGACVEQNATGLPTPCQNGPGQTLFRFHYDNGSTSARIDVWDASCSYSFANQACNVREVYPGFGDLDRTSAGYPVCTSNEYIRVRYSVAGIPFTTATLYVQARSYATGSSTSIEAWSPIYGSAISGLVDNDFVYDWYAIDWSNFLSTSDDPNLTAIQLYAYQGSNSLAVKAVELCLE